MEKSITRLSTKGRVEIPKEYRDRHPWTAGEVLWIEERHDGILPRPGGAPAMKQSSDLLGITGSSGPNSSLEDIEAVITEESYELVRAADAAKPKSAIDRADSGCQPAAEARTCSWSCAPRLATDTKGPDDQ